MNEVWGENYEGGKEPLADNLFRPLSHAMGTTWEQDPGHPLCLHSVGSCSILVVVVVVIKSVLCLLFLVRMVCEGL